MNNQHSYRTNSAVSGVIEALLLVALVAVVISTIQLVYIPQVMEQREAEHMDEVSNQFSYLKSMVDIQTMTNSSVPIFSMITLGSKELPYFVTARAFGDVRIIGGNTYKIQTNPAMPQGFPTGIPLTSITYEASNAYFVDQSYILEGGGIIVKQPDGDSVMRADPSISVENKTNEINIRYSLPIIVGIPEKNNTNGYGKCFVRTNLSRLQGGTVANPNINSINITTQYPNAWNESLHKIFENNVNYNEGTTYIEITKKIKTINFYLTYYRIYVQIGPGWLI